MSVVREDIQESPHKIQILSSDVGDLEDGTYPLTDELSCSVDGVLAILDEDRNFPCAGRL